MTKNKFDPQKHHRRSIRLPNYDYAQLGAYFITIVAYHRDLLFGEIINETMRLNDFGNIVDEYWRATPEHFPNVELGAYVVMPNHVHGIIVIKDNTTTTNSPLTVGARHVSPLPQPSKPHGHKRGSIGASLDHSKLPSRVISLANTMLRAFGNAIITNISSVMKRICKTKRTI